MNYYKLQKLSVCARLGASTRIVLRLETTNIRFTPITNITKSAPMRVTAPSHGLLDQWKVAIVDVIGMRQVNAVDSNAIRDKEFHLVDVIDDNTVDFPAISSSSFSTYASGGSLAYYIPFDMSAYTSARADVKRSVGGPVVLALSTETGTLEIDAGSSSLYINLDPSDLDGMECRSYVFDIELARPDGIDAICSADSEFCVLPEVTTSL